MKSCLRFSLFISLLLIITLASVHASPIVLNNGALENATAIMTPTKSHPLQIINNDKRDVIDLHNSGGGKSTTTTTKTSTSTATATSTSKPRPTSAPSSNPEDIYGGIGITPQNGVAGAFLIVLGLYLMVFGFRSFRITLAVCGFLTFGLITWVAMANNQPYYGYINHDITIIAVPAGLGILGAIIYAFFWNISIYLVGALGGFTLAMYILCCKADLLITQVVARAAFLVALPFFMSFITFFAERYVLLFTFAFAGSYCFIVGIEFLAHTGYLAGIKSILDGNPYHQVVYTITRNVIILIAFIPIIFVISFGWQFMYNKGQMFGVVFASPAPKKADSKGGSEKEASEEGPGEPGPVDEHQPHIKE
ncbi:hypothetical protein MAM1_0216c08155 [Mucor ambiguus]|uniref:TM7S3/TM198-like domain-containing protein n=1 Tax=Mucor ambiguus TaxID=91626 RepID=A0A0C9LWJ6_9FUNG|nr:hypothetical protein MAM1_0216c08155 [Mucor ambiguus]